MNTKTKSKVIKIVLADAYVLNKNMRGNLINNPNNFEKQFPIININISLEIYAPRTPQTHTYKPKQKKIIRNSVYSASNFRIGFLLQNKALLRPVCSFVGD